MTGSEIISASQTFTAVFTSQIPDDNDFAIPNATGTVATNGTGAVKLSAVNDQRHYVLTDKDGNIIAVKTGNELMSGDFSPVELNKEYKVYEVKDSVPTTLTGDINTVVNSGIRSQPTSVIVPPVGANVNVGNDAANAGQKTITVSPTAPNTEYSLIDANGNVVPASGWVAPSTPGAAIVFDNLDPNTTSTVVALTGTAPSPSTTPLPVKYTVKFNRSAVAESVQSGIRNHVGDTTNSMKFPWSMKVSVAREVNGINKPVASASNADIKVKAHIEQSLLGNMDYKLYKLNASTGDYEAVNTRPFDLSAANFGGDFDFDAAEGDVFVLSYKKAQKVIVKSEKDGTVNETLHVANGGVMTDDANYVSIRGALATYTDPHTGEEFLFDHFAKGSATGAAFADSDPVTRDLTVFAVYAPDPDWHNAKTNLTNEINRGNGLLGNANLTPTERADLINQINQAVGVNNKLNPGPTTLELSNEHIDLQTLIDSIIARINGTSPAPTPGGGGSSRGVTGSTTPSGTGNRVYQNGAEGNWVNFDPAGHGWSFELGNSRKLTNTWADVAYTFDGQTKIYSYHFEENGVMDSGWWKNNRGVWYHLSTNHDGWFGSMDKGWYHDSADGKWYYLNIMTGSMLTGWQEINGTWYYLNPVTPAPTWDWDASQNRWVYGNRGGRPYGSMYANEVTPDGYHVDASGAWIRETP